MIERVEVDRVDVDEAEAVDSVPETPIAIGVQQPVLLSLGLKAEESLSRPH